MKRRNRDGYTDPVRQAGRRLAEVAGDADWRAYARDVRTLVDRTQLPVDHVEKLLRELGMWDILPPADACEGADGCGGILVVGRRGGGRRYFVAVDHPPEALQLAASLIRHNRAWTHRLGRAEDDVLHALGQYGDIKGSSGVPAILSSVVVSQSRS